MIWRAFHHHLLGGHKPFVYLHPFRAAMMPGRDGLPGEAQTVSVPALGVDVKFDVLAMQLAQQVNN